MPLPVVNCGSSISTLRLALPLLLFARGKHTLRPHRPTPLSPPHLLSSSPLRDNCEGLGGTDPREAAAAGHGLPRSARVEVRSEGRQEEASEEGKGRWGGWRTCGGGGGGGGGGGRGGGGRRGTGGGREEKRRRGWREEEGEEGEERGGSSRRGIIADRGVGRLVVDRTKKALRPPGVSVHVGRCGRSSWRDLTTRSTRPGR